MKKPLALHPILFAIFFVLALYSYNVAEVSPSEIALPIAIVLGCTLLLLLLSWLLLKDAPKAGVVISIFVVLFFSYGYVAVGIENWGVTYKALWPIWVLIVVLSMYLVIRTRRDLRKLTTILNVIAITLVIIPTVNIAIQETKAASLDTNPGGNVGTYVTDLEETDALPDIYYIDLDRYASESTLKEFYSYDNSEFLDYLSSKGFYIASESKANYLKTHLSLASSLNMKYVNYLSEIVGEDSSDLDPFYEMLQDYEVWRFLKSKGYKYIHLGSWWEPTRKNEYADVNFNYWEVPQFSMTLFKTTMFYAIALENERLPNWLRAPFIKEYRKAHWERILYQFDKLSEIPNMKEPTFVFAHLLVPHDPYIFDREGTYLTLEDEKKRSRIVNYVDQLIFTNSKVKALVDELLSNSEVPPIIILQSDEGPHPERYALDETNFKWEEATEAELREKMGILSAYYLPNVDNSVLYPSITPVNSFRLVFNLYFDTNFELLPDRVYAFHSNRYQYKLFDVTDKLKYDQQ